MIPLDLDRLEAFVARLDAHARRRLRQEDLWQLFAASFPGRPQGAEERQWLVAALRSLADRGKLRLPNDAAWDRHLGVALPRTVHRVVAADLSSSEQWRAFPWHPRLSWVADLGSLSDFEELFLRRVHEGLVQRWFERAAPLKYRSLQLTGDEKALVALRRGRLFATGRLDDVLIACIPDVTPLAWAPVGTGPVMLAFENAGSFYVARDVLRSLSLRAIGIVACGEGARFASSVRDVVAIGPRPQLIAYVGDLDWEGLEIAHRARHMSPVPLVAAPAFHQAMLDSARVLDAPEGWPVRAAQSARSDPSSLLGFIPELARTPIAAVLAANRRIPEEVLGPEEMAAAAIAADAALAEGS